jgi:hypothetical protein
MDWLFFEDVCLSRRANIGSSSLHQDDQGVSPRIPNPEQWIDLDTRGIQQGG